MPGKKIISGTMLLTIAAAVIGERKAGRSLPRPRALAAILAMYGILGLVAELGREAERIAGAIAVTLLIATVFLGAAGKTIVDFLNTATGWIGGTGAAGQPSAVSAAASAAASNVAGAAGRLFTEANPATALRPARP